MLSHFSRVQLFVTSETVAYQAPLSIGFSRQEHCSGSPFPPPGDLLNQGIKPVSLALAGRFFTASTTWDNERQKCRKFASEKCRDSAEILRKRNMGVPEHQLWVPFFVHQACSVHLFYIWQYTCFSVILSYRATLAFSPHSPKVCSLYLCLLCCLENRVIITAFLNSIHMH